MDQPNPEFAKKLLATFQVEADEHLRVMSRGLVELEQASSAAPRNDLLETVFREAHSLKGAARAVNLAEAEVLCRSLEDVFSALKRQALDPTPTLFDLLHSALDALRELLRFSGDVKASAKRASVEELARAIRSHLGSGAGASERAAEVLVARPSAKAFEPGISSREGDRMGLPDVVRVSTAKLNSLLLQAEELLTVKLALAERADELRQLSEKLAAWGKRRQSFQSELRRLDRASAEKREGSATNAASGVPRKLLEYLDWNDDLLRWVETGMGATRGRLERDYRTLSVMSDRLLADITASLTLPFSVLLEPFPRLVRDLARDRQKEVEFIVHGGEIQVDRRVLEAMKDPLIHLIRNAADHGIESPLARQQSGKPARGTIVLAVSQSQGDKFEIVLSDDGSGVDASNVRASARKLGIVSPEQDRQMDDSSACRLIFRSGVSTSPILTDLSGRGLGLAIVDERVRGLGGSISLETQAGRGVTFRILLPVTLAVFRGVLVRCGERLFVLPMARVERAARLSRKDVKTVGNRETIPLDGALVSLVQLEVALELALQRSPDDPPETVDVVVLGSASQRVAFQVDEILQEQAVLVKPLGPALARLKLIAGAGVLGTGQVVPVLNAVELLQGAARTAPQRAGAAPAEAAARPPRSILVAEDSITARTLLKNILESAGFKVQTSVDGMEAYTLLRTEPFDLVVSDVDMPRMSGFDLTAKIRADTRLQNLPVVLVTALESRQDRERGIDVGASAYIVKSSFDQSNLLEVIHRLI